MIPWLTAGLSATANRATMPAAPAAPEGAVLVTVRGHLRPTFLTGISAMLLERRAGLQV